LCFHKRDKGKECNGIPSIKLRGISIAYPLSISLSGAPSYIRKMLYQYLKAIHIIFIVTWFAGLFYMPRLLIYDVEARDKQEPERSILVNQFRIMQKRLWFGITWPSFVLTMILGPWLVTAAGFPWNSRWLVIKLTLVAGLVLYHFSLQYIYNTQRKGLALFTSNQLRMWNEVATLFLVSIVFLVVLKSELDMLYGLAGLIALVVVLMLAIRIYKRIRSKA
jgi:putative membrane protein